MTMKQNSKPVALTIAGFDPSGGAGVIADVKTLMAFGCFPTAAVTSLTFQNTAGVLGVRHRSAAEVIAQVMPVIDDFEIAAVKTGMLPTGAIIKAIADLVRTKKIPAPVVDPVVVSTSGHRLITARALAVLKHDLLPLARIVTPNIPEAELLTGRSIVTEADMLAAAEAICDQGAYAVLLKGGHRKHKRSGRNKSREAVDILWADGTATYFRAPWIQTTSTHGTGCTLSAAIAAGMARGKSLVESVAEAKEFVHAAISHAPGIGKGNGPVDHGWQFPSRS
jgi:hydroxymethylpyrimidine/phosphomethylpyrimidine kinase